MNFSKPLLFCVTYLAVAGATFGQAQQITSKEVIVLEQQPSKPHLVQLVWMGGNDCPPCVVWRKDELPKLKESAEFKAITFSYVVKLIRSPVPSRIFLPADVKPFKDKLDYASSGRIGSPQAALLVNGEVVDYFYGTRSAQEIESMLLAVRTGTKYPFERCLKVSTQGRKCDIPG